MITAETVNGIVRFQANGLPVVSRHGGCGTCRVLLVDGEVEQAGSSFALPRADRADGWILACAGAPS